MDNRGYEIEFTDKAFKELKKILHNLSKKNLVLKLIKDIEYKIRILEYTPQLYPKIEKIDELGRTFRKIILKKYIIFYTIDENKKKLYISHIFYKKSNYFNKL